MGFTFILTQVVHIGKFMELVVRRESFMKCVKIISMCDNMLKKEEIVISYKLVHIFLLAFYYFIPVYVFLIIMPLWDLVEELQLNGFRSLVALKLIIQGTNLGILFVIRGISIYLYITFVIAVYQRLKFLNEHALEIENNCSEDKNVVANLLTIISKLHSTVVELIEHINATFGWSVFWNMSMAFLDIITVVVTREEIAGLKSHSLTFATVIIATSALILLIPCQKVLYEASFF